MNNSHYKNKPGYVYLIHAEGTKRYKIGMTTKHISQRFNQFSSGQSPYPLKLISVISSSNAYELEKKIHRHFVEHRVYGEWFEFDRIDLRYVLGYFSKNDQFSGSKKSKTFGKSGIALIIAAIIALLLMFLF